MLQILLILHLLLFAFAFAFTAGMGILQARAARSADASKIHTVYAMTRPFALTGGMLWIATAFAGIMLAMVAGMPLDQHWLAHSYIAFLVLILVGFGVHLPYQNKVILASANGPSPELDALLKSPVAPLASAVSAITIIAILYFMTERMG